MYDQHPPALTRSGVRPTSLRARPVRRWTLAVVTALALVAAACSDTDDTSSSSSPADTVASDASGTRADEIGVAAAGSAIVFDACGAFECASVEVPLDHDDPNGATTTLHVTMAPATGDRIGTLFVNPGGPGLGARGMVEGLSRFGPPALDRFDLVGVDPRGTGDSNPVRCNDDWETTDALLLLSPDDGLVDDVDASVVEFDAMAERCSERYDPAFLASMTTENAARDLELVRIALGDEPLTYLGQSYGTAIGAIHASLFPSSVRAMVLDSAIPIGTADRDAQFLDWGRRLDDALGRLDRSCELWQDCPVGEIGLMSAVAEVRQRLADGELAPLTPGTLNQAVGMMISFRPAMMDVAAALDRALAGDPSMLDGIGRSSLTPLEDGGVDEFSGATTAVICADGWHHDASTTAALLPTAEATDAALPLLGAGWGEPCDRWPVQGSEAPTIGHRGTAPILVVASNHDAITPVAWSERLSDQLGDTATLLRWDGSEHSPVFSGASRCLDEVVVALLVDLQPPGSDSSCVLRGLMGLGHGDDGPVRITRVTPGSPAEAAGILVGDVIVSEQGTAIATPADFAIGAAGERVVLGVERNSELLEIEVERGFPIWELWRQDGMG